MKISNKTKKTLIYIAAVVLIIAAVVYYFWNRGQDPESGTSQATGQTVSVPTAEPGGSDVSGTDAPQQTSDNKPDENGNYTSKEDVALYIHTYGKLPKNFITKDEAKALGWSGNGNDLLEEVAPGKSIGGDKFGNYEKLLPTKKGRTYYECDIDTYNKVRGTKRIVFSDDGLVYYTEDHYEHFELLYGSP